MWLKENPYSGYRRVTRQEYVQRALQQGHVATNSILRDWVKAQITIIESGIVSFEAVFMPFMLTSDGRTVIERIKDTNLLLPPEKIRATQGGKYFTGTVSVQAPIDERAAAMSAGTEI